MCGIVGLVTKGSTQNSSEIAQAMLDALSNRGKDGTGWFALNSSSITPTPNSSPLILGHVLHAIVGHVAQPIMRKGVLVANCEIYNYKVLASKLGITTYANDTDVLCQVLDKIATLDGASIQVALSQLEGPYAFLYYRDGVLVLARDILGEKPLHYINSPQHFACASSQASLDQFTIPIHELHPRHILTLQNGALQTYVRPFYTLEPPMTLSWEEILPELATHLEDAVLSLVPDCSLGVLFSGGIDSYLIAHILKKHNVPFTAFVSSAFTTSHDLELARKAAKTLQIPLIEAIGCEEADVKEVVRTLRNTNVVKVGVALSFHLALKKAKEHGCRVIMSGLGSEELFAGYERHIASPNLNSEGISGLRKLYERDLSRDDAVTMLHTIELRLPFLQDKLIRYALKIPSEFKVKDGQRKWILRKAAMHLGVPALYAEMPKKAAQYGSGLDRMLELYMKKGGFETKSQYLDSFALQKNQRLGILLSGGKDSLYAAHTMKRQNYPLTCAITIASLNPDSYMFHTPAISLTELQCKAMGIPQLLVSSAGEKEAELLDLERAIREAKETYNIQGICTGALFSTYQRDRIERICDTVGLAIFSPLWHKPQVQVLKELVHEKFEVILTKVCAQGLDASFVGVRLDSQLIEKLMYVAQTQQINPAGEGGEFESLVLDCPLFTQKLVLETNVQTQGLVSELIISNAKLVAKHV